MASPQAENGHVRIASELYTQILMRDFSKRQRAILDLIIRLSYGCAKKTADIPLTRYFVLCGIPANKVRRELDSLRALRVIDWLTSVYWLNKDYDQWVIEKPDEDAGAAFRELLKHNIESRDDQNGHAQNVHDQNVQQDMPKTFIKTCPKRAYELPATSSGSKAGEVPITKDNNIKTKEISTTTTAKSDLESYIDEIQFHMQRCMVDHNYIVKDKSRQAVVALFEERVPLEFVKEGIDEAFENYAPKGRLDKIRNFAYCAPRIEQRWMEQNLKTDSSVITRNGGKLNNAIWPRTERGGNRTRHAPEAEESWSAIESKFFGE